MADALAGLSTAALLPNPLELGFSQKFAKWRPHQDEAAAAVIDSPKRFIGLTAQTGLGKSLVYCYAARLLGLRTVILATTKNLQTQLLQDFGGTGMVDIRGRANFPCQMNPELNCEQGAQLNCQARIPSVKGDLPECPYMLQYLAACASDLVVTNYSYWIAVNKFGKGLGRRDLLVLDEAHNAPNEVCEAMAVRLTTRDVYRRLNSGPALENTIEAWGEWARQRLPEAEEAAEHQEALLVIDSGSTAIEEALHMKALVTWLETIATATGRWVVAEQAGGGGWNFDPVWADRYAEKMLFRGVGKVVLVSATLTRKTMELLGISKSEYDFFEFQSTFPPDRCPVYYTPATKLNRNLGTDTEMTEKWVTAIDAIVGPRLDRKGIILTSSYNQAKLLFSASNYSRYMLIHNPGSEAAANQLKKFRAMSAPLVLASPVLWEGLDLPYEQCEFIIVSKLPFPDTRVPVEAARCGRDYPKGDRSIEAVLARAVGEDYSLHFTAQAVEQGCGRARRVEDDQCEVFIIDANWGRWFYQLASKHMAMWFKRQIRDRSRKGLPAPLPRLNRSKKENGNGDNSNCQGAVLG